MELITKNGFKCNIDENRVKDWRFVSASAKLAKSSNDIDAIYNLNFCIEFLFGEKQARELYEFLEKLKGYVDSEDVSTEYKYVVDMLKEQVTLKKSSASSE